MDAWVLLISNATTVPGFFFFLFIEPLINCVDGLKSQKRGGVNEGNS